MPLNVARSVFKCWPFSTWLGRWLYYKSLIECYLNCWPNLLEFHWLVVVEFHFVSGIYLKIFITTLINYLLAIIILYKKTKLKFNFIIIIKKIFIQQTGAKYITINHNNVLPHESHHTHKNMLMLSLRWRLFLFKYTIIIT